MGCRWVRLPLLHHAPATHKLCREKTEKGRGNRKRAKSANKQKHTTQNCNKLN